MDKPSTSAAVNPARENARLRLVEKYKEATAKLVKEQHDKIIEMKSRTPLQGLLGTHKKKEETESTARTVKEATDTAEAATKNQQLNPFKAMAAAASEWMESMGGMFPYMPGMLPGMGGQFRPPFVGLPRGMMAGAYRGMPRMRGGYFGRGRGRGGYDPNYSGYRQQTEENESVNETGVDGKYHPYHYAGGRFPRGRRGGYKRGGKDYYHTKRHSHRHHRSHSRSRSTSYSRSRSRSNGRRHYSKRSRSRSCTRSSYSRSHSRSHSRSDKPSKKLVSTRRSRTVSYSSSSRSRSRSHRNRHRSSRRHSRRNSERSGSRRRHSVMLEADELVRDAEVIKRTIETEVLARMREEELEIKRKFRPISSNNHSVSKEHVNINFENDKIMENEEREISVENSHEDKNHQSRSRSRSYENGRHNNNNRKHSRRSFSPDEEE